MQLISILLIASAISIDAFGVGVVYGIKKINLQIKTILFISLSTSIVITISIMLGKILSPFLSTGIERLISGSVLLIIGLFQLFNGWKERKLSKIINDPNKPTSLFTIRIRSLGIILDIMSDPTKADFDHSKHISIKEAILLSIALNMDALGAGLSVGLMGYSFLLAPFSAIILFFTLKLGLFIGQKYLSKYKDDRSYFFTGIILMVIGLNNFMKKTML